MSASAGGGGSSQTIDLSTLPAAQLSQLKKQLDTEIEHLSASFQKLRSAQSKFRECSKAVSEGLKKENNEKDILVPLTTSLYVPGRLVAGEKVLVDVGTGFYVEKGVKDAVTFYNGKVEELDKNLKELDQILQGKAGNLRVVEEFLRQKVLSDNGVTAPAS